MELDLSRLISLLILVYYSMSLWGMIRGQEVISNLLCSSYLKDRRGTTVYQIYAARMFGLPTVIWGSLDFHFTFLCISSTDSRPHRQVGVTVQRGVDSSYSFLIRHYRL